MPRATAIVIDASPIVALVAALGDLTVLKMYDSVWVPHEVAVEIVAGGAAQFAVAEFEAADWLMRIRTPVIPGPALANSLDLGEAAVIQVALDKGIPTVCIDEIVGRRIARLHGLVVTGLIGILLRAKEEGADFSPSHFTASV